MDTLDATSPSGLRKLSKKPWALLSLVYLFICLLLGVFAYQIAPDSSRNANQMHVSIHSKSPGFRVKMLTIPSGTKSEQSFWDATFFGTTNRDTEIPIQRLTVQGDYLLAVPYDAGDKIETSNKIPLSKFPNSQSAQQLIQKYVSYKTFWFGTDKYGRDLLSRMIIGIRVSIAIGFVSVLLSLLIGIPLGAIAGYYGGLTDKLISWLVQVIWSIPTLLMVIAITVAFKEKGFWQVFLAVGMTMWVEVARVVRGKVMEVKQRQYITAAKALGYSNFRILTKHVLPNIFSPIIIISAANFAAAILIESGLSFLGIGAQPPMPSWGAMIKDHYSYIILGKAYLAIIPGLGIMSLVLSFMLIGSSLRDVLDVKT